MTSKGAAYVSWLNTQNAKLAALYAAAGHTPIAASSAMATQQQQHLDDLEQYRAPDPYVEALQKYRR
jgi:hypothetical protein